MLKMLKKPMLDWILILRKIFLKDLEITRHKLHKVQTKGIDLKYLT